MCLRKIRENGGEKDNYSISFPVSTAQIDKKNIEIIFEKKLKKIIIYGYSQKTVI